ncbi:hypothetical protein UYO_3197, partial [Lachnospiraceae bacterium JC7]
DSLIKKLNGKKYLIKGNHDKNYDPRLFTDIQDFLKISVDGNHFSLMHYPMLSWPKKGSGGYQLHGHIHARMDYNEANRSEGQRRYDVGVDANNFFPVSSKQIVEFFEECRERDDSISRKTLNMIGTAISNLKEGRVSEGIF